MKNEDKIFIKQAMTSAIELIEMAVHSGAISPDGAVFVKEMLDEYIKKSDQEE